MNHEQQKKDVIMGVMMYYTWEEIKPYFLSLEKTGYTGEVVIFIDYIGEETQNILKNLNLDIQLIPFHRTGLENIFHINDYRYYLYLNFLEANSDRYTNVLLTDVRDVYFQSNPFQAGWSEECITVAKEAVRIKEEYWNTKWILTKFGHHIYSQIENETVICSGTTYGPARRIVEYVKNMVHYLFYLDYYHLIVNDQAVHNYLVHTRKINPISFVDNHNGPIMTLAFESNIKISDQNQVLLKNGTVAPILHQYDRHSWLGTLIKDLCN
ncbi:MAG: hypothetical protein K0S80_2177 [Neobacillus sp.]|nr:hypothetical protein [Neobacillus sp.]